MTIQVVNTEKEARDIAENLLSGPCGAAEAAPISIAEWASHRAENTRGRRKDFQMENRETGALAFFIHTCGDAGMLYGLSPAEADPHNRTFVFSRLPNKWAGLAIAMKAHIFKPVKELRPESVLSYPSVMAVETFFGSGDYWPHNEERILRECDTVGTAFCVEAGEEGEKCRFEAYLLPEKLTELTGRKIGSVEDYVNAVSLWLDCELTEAQAEAVRKGYAEDTALLLIRYAAYEFFRTEKYDRLKEILQLCPKLLMLPDDWPLLWGGCSRAVFEEGKRGLSVDAIVLAAYLSDRPRVIVGVNDLSEIADYTGAPLSLLYKAGKVEDKDFFS